MTDDLVKRLRDSCYLAFDDGTNDYATAIEAADRIEALEAALVRIWSWYPTNVSNPHQQINEMKDFAFNIIKEGNSALGEKKDGS